MTVSISKMSIEYYLQSAMTADAQINNKPTDMTAYYTESSTPAGRWFGSGLTALGMDQGKEVTRASAIRLYEGMSHPETGEPLGRRMKQSQTPVVGKTPAGRTSISKRNSVAGFDLTFSAPKSVSTLWALGDYSIQREVEAAHRQAMNETISWVEANVAQTRAGHAGVAHVPVTGIIGSVFDHWESRAGDPQLHSHAVVSNRVQRASDGQWVTLDSYTLHRHVVAISETYNSLLYDRLHERLGTVAESRDPHANHDMDAALRAVMSGDDMESPEVQHRTELSGVPDGVIELFSARSAAIEERTAELTQDYIDTHGREPAQATVLQLRQRATLETRESKATGDEAATPLAEKKHLWRQRAIQAGHDPAQIVQASTRLDGSTIDPSMIDTASQSQLAQWTLADASTRHATFTRANVIASSERVLRLVRCASVDQRRELVDSVVDEAMEQAVPLTPRRSTAPTEADDFTTHRGVSAFDHQRHSGVWTTREVLESEQYILDRYEATDAPSVPEDGLQDKLAQMTTGSGHTLSEDQQRASHAVLSSGRGVDAVIGPAGTGKTTTMRAVSDAWQEHYGFGSVVGLAPSAAAAGVLADDLGVSTENTAKWVYETTEGAARRKERMASRGTTLKELQQRAGDNPNQAQKVQMQQLRSLLAQDLAEDSRFTLRTGQLVLIDEASMVSTAQMTQLTELAENANAKVVLVGDPAQLGSVDAGGMLGAIDRGHDPARLDQAWRFTNEWEREASLALRTGNTDVLATYDEQGRLHGGDDADAVAQAYAAWRADQGRGKDTILIAPDNATVRELNQQAQADLVQDGTVNVEATVTLKNDTHAGQGDVLLARRNDRSIRDSTGAFLSNGTRLTVNEVRPDGSAEGYSHRTGGTVELDANYLAQSVELGYATTAHRAQGVTTDTAHSVANTALSRELFYVSMTRGREENHAYVYHEPFEEGARDQWELLNEIEPEGTPAQLLEPVVKRARAERTATETTADELAWSNDLGRLLHEREYIGWSGRSERTQQWIEQNYPSDTADQLLESPYWNTLTKADPKLRHVGPVKPDDSVESIINRCTRELNPDHGPSGISPHVQPATVGQDELFVDVDQRTDTELSSRRRTLATDPEPPQWYRNLNDEIKDPEHRREAINAVLAWRAVSDRDELTEPLGPPPERNDHLRPYYDRAVDVLRERNPWKGQYNPEHAKHAQALKNDRLDVPVPVPAHPAREPDHTPQRVRPKTTGPEIG